MPRAKDSSISRQAWNLLRLVLLWARRGGAFKLHLRVLVPKILKTIGRTTTPRSHIWYGERELSFEKTPVVHVQMHRPRSMRFMLPCINPKLDFDMEFDKEHFDRVCHGFDSNRKSCFVEKGDKEDCFYDVGYSRMESKEEDPDIDSRAEEFIAKFYQQMKLQRQMSYLQYNEMLN